MEKVQEKEHWQKKATEKEGGVERSEEPEGGTKCVGRGCGLERGFTTYSIQTRSAAYEIFHTGED